MAHSYLTMSVRSGLVKTYADVFTFALQVVQMLGSADLKTQPGFRRVRIEKVDVFVDGERQERRRIEFA